MDEEQPHWRQVKKERRGLHRIPAHERASLASSSLGHVSAELLDLSQSGCRIRTRVSCRRGDRFVLRIGTFGPRAVTAAWRQGDTIGVEFAQPLAWAVVATIAAKGVVAVGGSAFSGG